MCVHILIEVHGYGPLHMPVLEHALINGYFQRLVLCVGTTLAQLTVSIKWATQLSYQQTVYVKWYIISIILNVISELVHICTHVCVMKLDKDWFTYWVVASSVMTHYLNQCELLSFGSIKSYFRAIWIKMHQFPFKKMYWGTSSTKLRPFPFGINILKTRQADRTAAW